MDLFFYIFPTATEHMVIIEERAAAKQDQDFRSDFHSTDCSCLKQLQRTLFTLNIHLCLMFDRIVL